MRTLSVLLLLLTLGIAYVVLPETLLGLPTSELSRAYSLWSGSVKLLVFPFCFLVMVFNRSTVLRIGRLLWGLWMAMLSALVLVKLESVAPTVTVWGTALVAVEFIGAISLTLFETIELSKLAPSLKEEPKPAAESSPIDVLVSPESTSATDSRKVEGT